MRNPAARGGDDANQPEIVRAYEEAYCSVVDLSSLGGGISDLLVGFGGEAGGWVLREIKTCTGRLLKSQTEFRVSVRGPSPLVIRSAADALDDVVNLRARIARGRV